MIIRNANRDIGPELEKLFEPVVEFPDVPLSSNLTEKLSEIIYRNIGIKTKWHIVDHPSVDMAILSKIHFGHQSSRYVSDPTLQHGLNFSPNPAYMEPFKGQLKVDLTNFKVSGPMVDSVYFDCFLFTGFFKVGFNAREITAGILHECGHLFNTFMTMGEYAYLSYLLQQGVEDLAEGRPGTFVVELMSDAWVKANVDSKVYKEFLHERTVDGARRVILNAIKNLPRFHLTDSTRSAKAKEEQLADTYPIRLGYGRELAVVANKMHKLDAHNHLDGKIVHYLTQLIKAPFYLVNLPLFYILYDIKSSSYNHNYGVDQPVDRLKGIKTTLISDLKRVEDDTVKKVIVDDIDSIDRLIATYYDNINFIDAVMYFISPTVRRDIQRKDQEKMLERLMNNDLFHLSAKIQR